MLTGRSRMILPLALIAALGLAACSPPRSIANDRPANAIAQGSPYNLYLARLALGEALIEERAGNSAKAETSFRDAAVKWPGMTRAWRGLARTTDETSEQEAANFLAARTSLLESNDIITQREVATALRAYLDDQREAPDANPLTLEYGEELASFYSDLYRVRGEYEAPKRFGNIQPNEVPAAVFTGAFTSIYFGTVLTGD